jgi:hypothetical protein
LHLVWLFPWSVYLPAIAKLSFKPVDRAGRTRLLALCWVGFVMVFFTFSTTQEYYSMPIYPALALLLGSAVAMGGSWVRWGTRALTVIAGAAAIACFTLFFLVRNYPTPGDISAALSHHPGVYSLSLGHMLDLTLGSFAYLRMPLLLAGVAFLIGSVATLQADARRTALATAAMMVLFFHAARLAMVTFDPFLSSRPLADAVVRSPQGRLIMGDQYYTFSSMMFYTNQDALLLNGRYFNLEYGSYAPDSPPVFINDEQFKNLWLEQNRYYVIASRPQLPIFERLLGPQGLNLVAESGGKFLLTNHPTADSRLLSGAVQAAAGGF